MHIYIFCILLISGNNLFAARIFIKNWGMFPLTVSEVFAPEHEHALNLKTNISIQPGQSMPLSVDMHNKIFNNFNQINVTFNVNGHIKKETIFFPDAYDQETSLSFTDSGYKRFPFNTFARNG